MTVGFYIILAAQFLSALADNSLLIGAISRLQEMNAPPEFKPVMHEFFTIPYVLLAPYVGAFADALPKGRVMFISNTIKLVGCIAMLAGVHPLFAYGVVGLGAAAYSPAKYGILTEYLPPEQLVVANSWMEGLTVLSIILGALLGGFLINPHVAVYQYLATHLPGIAESRLTVSEYAIGMVMFLYMAAAVFNLYIPRVAIDHKLPNKNPIYILQDFARSFSLLWRDPLGQVSLAVTTLFWGVGATLRFIVLDWASVALSFSLEKATRLTAWTAIGIAVGAILAARNVRLDNSLKVLPVGIAMGFAVVGMVFVHDQISAACLLIVAGAMGGYFVVPMNALLQHRGHKLMGAGHSIAVQNLNENISILLMLGIYAMLIRAQVGIMQVIVVFGVFISTCMAILYRRHRNDQVE